MKKSTEIPKVVASEIGRDLEEPREDRSKKVGAMGSRILYLGEIQANVRVNSYMKCGWKKVEPPTQDKGKFT